MPRILLIGDIHLADNPPSSCTATYTDDLFDMLDYCAGLAEKYDVHATVWAGDVFHHKQPARNSHRLVLRTIEAARKFRNLKVIMGNHDMQNDVIDTIYKTQPFGVLLESGAAELLDGWDTELPLYGVQWQQRWQEPDYWPSAFDLWQSAGGVGEGTEFAALDLSKALVVTHAPIYPPGLELEFEFVPTRGEGGISEVMGNTGYLYYGHIHEPHGTFEVDGVTYSNQGSLSRGSRHEYNLTREIAVTLWTDEPFYDADDQFDLGFNRIVIPHKPASEVLRLVEGKEQKEAALDLSQFLSSVGETKLAVTSLESVVNHVQTMELEPAVKDAVIELLQEQA